MTSEQLITQMSEQLTQQFSPTALRISDESALHIGHPGAQPGRFHLALYLRAPCFAAQSAVQIHRQIYQSLAPWMQSSIHALRIDAAAA